MVLADAASIVGGLAGKYNPGGGVSAIRHRVFLPTNHSRLRAVDDRASDDLTILHDHRAEKGPAQPAMTRRHWTENLHLPGPVKPPTRIRRSTA
jgi:hypothetical protein